MDQKENACSASYVESASDDDIPLAELRENLIDNQDDIPLILLRTRKNLSSAPNTTQQEGGDHSDFFHGNDSDEDSDFQPGQCEVSDCTKEVWSACENCLILVCYDHCIEDVNSCQEHGKFLKKQPHEENSGKDQSAHQTTIEVNVDGKIFDNEEGTPQGTCHEVAPEEQSDPQRKRRSKCEEKEETKKRKLERKENRCAVKDGCGAGCRRKTKCREAITPEERKSANDHYFSLNYSGQKEFIFQSVLKEEVKRRTSSSKQKKKEFFLQVHSKRNRWQTS